MVDSERLNFFEAMLLLGFLEEGMFLLNESKEAFFYCKDSWVDLSRLASYGQGFRVRVLLSFLLGLLVKSSASMEFILLYFLPTDAWVYN
jgi:hypothetical protein